MKVKYYSIWPDHSGGSFWFFPSDFTIFSQQTREGVYCPATSCGSLCMVAMVAGSRCSHDVYLETAEGCWVSK